MINIMSAFSKFDYGLFKQIAQLSATSLLNTMEIYLTNKKYNSVTKSDKYLYAMGDIPITLVAHVDTVFSVPPKNIYYDRQEEILWSPEGLGADDRAGVYAIVKILKLGYKPHIIFTTDEELGAIGAINLIQDITGPFADMKYIIQLDRRGKQDCIFYDCDNKDFVAYIESFGFEKNYGTFSDISMICPSWGIAGVNLSVGYINEHSISETLHAVTLNDTIQKVIKMLNDVENSSYFNYIPDPKAFNWLKYYSLSGSVCHHCKKEFSEYEMFPVKCADGKNRYFCPDCIADNVNWCSVCDCAFEITDANKKDEIALCDDCKKELIGDVI